MSRQQDYDFGDIVIQGTETARKNWERMRQHAIAEWNGDLEATMATVSRNDPFQLFHATKTVIRGWDNVRAFYVERLKNFRGQGLHGHRVVVTDKFMVTEGYFKGSPEGMFFGAMTYGKPLFIPVTVWVYFEDTLVKGEAAYFDGNEFQRQIREGAVGDVKSPLF